MTDLSPEQATPGSALRLCRRYDAHFRPDGAWVEAVCRFNGCGNCDTRPETHPAGCTQDEKEPKAATRQEE